MAFGCRLGVREGRGVFFSEWLVRVVAILFGFDLVVLRARNVGLRVNVIILIITVITST